MSLFAGICALQGEGDRAELPQTAIATITRTISRGKNQIQTYETPRFFLAYVDVGAFHEPGFRLSAGAVTAVAGEPLIDASANHPPSRNQDLTQLAERLVGSEGVSVLRRCRGSFALCHYHESSDDLWLATDKIGVRPVYYHIGNQFLYFSTCLRVLEDLTQVPKRMDMRAMTEEVVLGYPLGDRTPYADVKILLSGELLHCAGGRPFHSRYFRLEEVEDTQLSLDKFLDSAYESFVSAVACRSNRDGSAVSFLSGGLDSRCIVAVLKDLGKQVSTIVFDAADTPDRIIAGQYASLIGSRHTVMELLPSRAPQELLTYGDQEYVETLDLSVAYPQLVFSGDDGSISVGYVYVEEAEVQLMKEGRVQQAIEQFLHDKPLPRKLFRADVYRRLKQVAFDGVLEELERIDVRNPEKAFYFFHMENSHRRILRKFVCEDIDVRRIEYVQPFYDGHFIELIASAPAAWGLAHRLYHQWLTRFPQQTVQVPWQTYPGHLPCPVKGLTITRTQWQPTRAKRFWASQPFLPRCWEAMTRWQFPCALMRRPVVLLAYALHQTRIKDYSYIIELCAKISDYFERCGGRLVFPE